MSEGRECSIKKSESLSRRKRSPSQRDWAKAIQELRPEHDLEILLEKTGMARATFYYHTKRLSEPDGYDDARTTIRKIYDHHKGRYGYRRITSQLRNDGIHLNHKTVQKLMVEMSLYGKRKKAKYKSYKGEIGRIAPNVIDREFIATAPNQKWTTDVTEVKIKDKKIYLSPILDMFNGEIISYTISYHPDLKMALSMLNKAFKGNSVIYTGVVCVKGDYVLNTHTNKLLERHSAVHRLSCSSSVLSSLVKHRHNYGNSSRLAA